MKNHIFLIFLFLPVSVAYSQTEESKIVEVETGVADQESEAPPSAISSIDQIMKFRDPFKGPDLKGGMGMESGSPLESFPTSDFKLLGVVTGPKKLKAMLLAPNGRTYFVKTLDRIGVREGRIEKILKDRLIVKEKVINLLGKEEQIFTAILMDSEGMPKTVNQ